MTAMSVAKARGLLTKSSCAFVHMKRPGGNGWTGPRPDDRLGDLATEKRPGAYTDADARALSVFATAV